jgi:hypothetical protein
MGETVIRHGNGRRVEIVRKHRISHRLLVSEHRREGDKDRVD